ncbi:MAG: hypothetical protein KDA89_00335 [Planctomycetaceae bacterium]|nr:hypothetical protein [Planctomycetaceae bacterium]
MRTNVATERSHPNPTRAHGAWIYLFASVASGAFIGNEHGIEAAMLVGTGFVGAFLMVAALSAGARRKRRQLLTGTGLAAFAPLCALGLDADPNFLQVAGLAALMGAVAIIIEKRFGFLSRAALVTGIATLALGAPVVASAGGATARQCVLLFALLWPFFSWRTLRVAAPLQNGATWDRVQLKTQGLREAAIAAIWTLVVTVSLLLM